MRLFIYQLRHLRFIAGACTIMLTMLTSRVSACTIVNSQGTEQTNLDDPLFHLLKNEGSCPQNVVAFRALLKNQGAMFTSTMVANRGFHNPGLGSFSFFEIAALRGSGRSKTATDSAKIFFGHFTAPGPDGALVLDQTPMQRSLMIELIAWDTRQEVYNFYELNGSEDGPRWFYRGNSIDIWSDTAKLHLSDTNPAFGKRLRCSGCHVAGGPIMKELSKPHDSWWTAQRKLPLGGRLPDPTTLAIIETLQDPKSLSTEVSEGLQKLMRGKAFKKKQLSSPQVALRPLFCAEELNLESDTNPLGNESLVNVPSAFFIDPRLGRAELNTLKARTYLRTLNALHSRFDELDREDADHAWLAPVKADADIFAIKHLIDRGLIDAEFVADVLAVDMTRPVFSKKRCSLLKLLPTTWTQHWRKDFAAALNQSTLPAAIDLGNNLKDPAMTAQFHQMRAAKVLNACAKSLGSDSGAEPLVRYLDQTRSEVSASEISHNPLGQILEPGFRVIFPTFRPKAEPWLFTLADDCMLR